MHVVVFGGTGAIGQLAVQAALDAGHRVTVYARSPRKLTIEHPDLRVVTGELFDADAVDRAVQDADAVLSLLGPMPRPTRGTPIADGMRRITASMQAHGVRRLVALATPSASDPADGTDWRYALVVRLVRWLGPHGRRDIRATVRVVRDTDLDWTIVRIGFLTNGPAGPVVAGPIGAPGAGLSVSRASVARFFVDQLDDLTWLRAAPVISTG